MLSDVPLVRAILAMTRELGRPPKQVELARHLGWRIGAVHSGVRRLKRQGVVARGDKWARGVELVTESCGWRACPFCVRSGDISEPG